MAKPRNDLLDRALYIALRLVHMMIHWFPVNVNLQTARLIGRILYALDRKHRKRAQANISRSFPEFSAKQVDELARRSMEGLIMLGIDVLFTTRLIRLDTWWKYVKLEGFEPVLHLLLKEKQPLIMITGHYGNWEILGYTFATLGFPVNAVARPLDNPYVNEWLLGVRQKQGQHIIDKRGAMNEVTDTLDDNGTIAFIADQNAGSKGIFVDFFGRKASTYKSIGLLAMRYRAPVVVGCARRIGDKFEFVLELQDIIFPESWDDHPKPLQYITQRYTAALEALIRKEPSQYLWVHRRWKTRPKGEPPEPYD